MPEAWFHVLLSGQTEILIGGDVAFGTRIWERSEMSFFFALLQAAHKFNASMILIRIITSVRRFRGHMLAISKVSTHLPPKFVSHFLAGCLLGEMCLLGCFNSLSTRWQLSNDKPPRLPHATRQLWVILLQTAGNGGCPLKIHQFHVSCECTTGGCRCFILEKLWRFPAFP